MHINLNDFEYIKLADKTGRFTGDVCRLLEVNNKNNTVNHVLSVAETSMKLAYKFKVDSGKCFKAALLHDIAAIVKPEDMVTIAEKNKMKLDAAEEKYPFLLHQRISKIIAEDYFGITDKDVLSSIECHTTLKSHPSSYEMILFIADKISWDQKGMPPYLDIIKEGLDVSLERACRNYIDYLYDNNKLLCPHKWMDEAHDYFSRK